MARAEPKSKRTTVRLRHKIEKASAAKQRKQRKLAKKNPQWRSRLKKDPGVPNLFPYKEQILQEVEEKRRLKEEEAQRRKQEAQSQRQQERKDDEAGQQEVRMEDASEEEPDQVESMDGNNDEEMETDPVDPMAALVMSARARAADFERQKRARKAGQDHDDDGSEPENAEVDVEEGPALLGDDDDDEELVPVEPLRKDTSRRAFDRVFKQVVDAADVILYVLDARDPEGTRSRDVERMVLAADAGQKRLILVLNKVDLVPTHVLKGWLAYLRRYFPTLPLRAAGPAVSAHTFQHKGLTVAHSASTLLNALKAFAATRQLKRAVSVGVIGYPNVGKSSVINALTGRLGGATVACPVGAEAGVTTSLRQVKLDRKLTLIDSPGIVFPDAASTDGGRRSSSLVDEQARLVLLNAVPAKQIDDPVPAVSLLLRRLGSSPDGLQRLLQYYSAPPLMPGPGGDPTMDFLIHVARKRGRLGRGGIPNTHSAAMAVLIDWRDGRIQGWTEPPTSRAAKAPASAATPAAAAGDGDRDGRGNADDGEVIVGGDHKTIVSTWAAEFKLEGLWGDGEGDDE